MKQNLKYIAAVLAILLLSLSLQSQETPEDGFYEEYYKNGKVEQSGNYKNGEKVGEWKSFFETGELSSITIYDQKGNPTGFSEDYYKNGKLQSIRTKIKDDIFLSKEFYEETGNIYVEKQLKPRKGDYDYFLNEGYYREYSPEEVLKIESNYINGELSGLWTEFYDSGEKEWQVDYYKGHRLGVYKQFYKTGTLKTEGVNVDDLKEGEEKRYDESGQLVWKGFYTKGKLNGKWIKYDVSGNEIDKIKFKRGETVSNVNTTMSPTEVPDGVIDKIPVYPGCEDELGTNAMKKCMSDKIAKFISKNFDTDIASELDLSGVQRINVIFKIDKTGEITGVRSRANHRSLEQEAIRVVKSLPKMIPGYVRGEPVMIPYSLPIFFEKKEPLFKRKSKRAK